MLFNGSTIDNNGSMINLDPVYTYIIYYITEPSDHRPWDLIPVNMTINFPSLNKSDSLFFYNSNQNITVQNGYDEINTNKLKHKKYFSKELNSNNNSNNNGKINNNISENESLEKTVNNNSGFLNEYGFFDSFKIYFENLLDFIKDFFSDLISDLNGILSYIKI